MKERVAVALACLWAAGLVCRAQETVSGRWEGSAQVPGRELKVVVDLARESGGWAGSVTIPGLNVKGVALSEIVAGGDELSFAVKGALTGQGSDPPKFKGRLESDSKFAGEFLQAGNRAPVLLEKTGPPQVEKPRSSTPIAREFEGEWTGQYEMLGYARNVTLKLSNRAGSGAAAELVIVGKKVNNLPVDLVTQESDLLTIHSPETGFTYEGRLKEGVLHGVLLQGPLEHPLVLKNSK